MTEKADGGGTPSINPFFQAAGTADAIAQRLQIGRETHVERFTELLLATLAAEPPS